jgi:hypothetical protein
VDDLLVRVRPLFGAALSLATVAFAGFLVYIAVVTPTDTQWFLFLPLALGVAVGLFLAVRVPDNSLGLVVLVGSLSLSLLGASELIQSWGVDHGQPVVSVVGSIVGSAGWTGMTVSMLVLLPIWFPNGVAINWWSRWTARVAIVLATIPFLAAVFSESVCVVWDDSLGCLTYEEIPWGLPGLDGSSFESIFVVITLLGVPAIVSAILRRRRATGIERAQLNWFNLAAFLFVVGFPLLTFNDVRISRDLIDTLAALALSGVWISIGVSVVKYRLYDINKLISRGLGYIVVIGILTIVYAVGAVWLPSELIGEQQPVFVAGTTLAIAALFNPLRKRTRLVVDRRFDRSSYKAEVVSDQFAARLREPFTTNGLSELWQQTVTDAVHPEAIGIWLSGTDSSPNIHRTPRSADRL